MQRLKNKTMSEFQLFGGAKLGLESDLGSCKGTSRELKRFAYTLAEVVLVMLVIAIIVGVSLKITKTKLDNILSVNYYYSYKTLNEIVIEMLKHYNPNNDKYKDEQEHETVDFYTWSVENLVVSKNPYPYAFSPPFSFDYPVYNISLGGESPVPFFIQHEFAETETFENFCKAGPPHWYDYAIPQISYQQYLAGERPLPPNEYTVAPSRFFVKCEGLYKFPAEVRERFPDWNSKEEVTFDVINLDTTFPRNYDVCSLPCDSNSSSGNCGPIRAEIEDTLGGPISYSAPGYLNFYEKPCKNGQECRSISGEGFGYQYSYSAPRLYCNSPSTWNPYDVNLFRREVFHYICYCDEEETNSIFPTIPLQGKNFCEMFASYVNTKDESCNGNAIGTDITDFSSKTPDIILRNGVGLFNMSQNPTKISILNGNSRGNKYTKANGTEVDIDEWGYTVYVDIDGASNGVNKLWEDVYPFYVTLSGTVIPAYDKDNAGESGGDSIQHLQTSVSRIIVGAKIEWVVKSKSFKESTCKMGYIKETTDYCKANTTVTQDKSKCPDEDSTCSLKLITPIKFF